MKSALFILSLLLTSLSGFGQSISASPVFSKLGEMDDQFNNRYRPGNVADQLVIVYIPGTNEPFQMIYNKKKGAKMVEGTLLIGGFKEMMSGMSYDSKKKHLQDALSIRYLKGSQILIDMDSEVAAMLSLQGYSIITLSKKMNEVVQLRDFGFDRVAFFKALKAYESE